MLKTQNRNFAHPNAEINNNLRDAQELINDECYDDALMIIQSLKTRKLSKEESEKLTELQAQMMHISD